VEFVVDAAALKHGFLRLLRFFSTTPPMFHIHTSLMYNGRNVTLATVGILKQNIPLYIQV
jgi:hypothetical protein